MMTYQALVVRLSEQIEEEVMIRIGDVELTGFAHVCPYPIEIGRIYPVELDPLVFDEYNIQNVDDDALESIIRTGDEYEYVVTGRFKDGAVKSQGLSFEDEIFATEFKYLNGTTVTFHIDRLDLCFV